VDQVRISGHAQAKVNCRRHVCRRTKEIQKLGTESSQQDLILLIGGLRATPGRGGEDQGAAGVSRLETARNKRGWTRKRYRSNAQSTRPIAGWSSVLQNTSGGGIGQPPEILWRARVPFVIGRRIAEIFLQPSAKLSAKLFGPTRRRRVRGMSTQAWIGTSSSNFADRAHRKRERG
jgi:hypothetical protein